MRTVLASLMRPHHVDMWVVPIREYNEDGHSPIVAPLRAAAPIYVCVDQCAHPERSSIHDMTSCGAERIRRRAGRSGCVGPQCLRQADERT